MLNYFLQGNLLVFREKRRQTKEILNHYAQSCKRFVQFHFEEKHLHILNSSSIEYHRYFLHLEYSQLFKSKYAELADFFSGITEPIISLYTFRKILNYYFIHL